MSGAYARWHERLHDVSVLTNFITGRVSRMKSSKFLPQRETPALRKLDTTGGKRGRNQMVCPQLSNGDARLRGQIDCRPVLHS